MFGCNSFVNFYYPKAGKFFSFLSLTDVFTAFHCDVIPLKITLFLIIFAVIALLGLCTSTYGL